LVLKRSTHTYDMGSVGSSSPGILESHHVLLNRCDCQILAQAPLLWPLPSSPVLDQWERQCLRPLDDDVPSRRGICIPLSFRSMYERLKSAGNAVRYCLLTIRDREFELPSLFPISSFFSTGNLQQRQTLVFLWCIHPAMSSHTHLDPECNPSSPSRLAHTGPSSSQLLLPCHSQAMIRVRQLPGAPRRAQGNEGKYISALWNELPPF